MDDNKGRSRRRKTLVEQLTFSKSVKKTLALLVATVMMLTSVDFGSAMTAFAATTNDIIVNGYDAVSNVSNDSNLPRQLAEGQVWSGKQVRDNADGSFDITLSALGKKFKTTEKTNQMYDVVFVLDYSGSMNENSRKSNMETAVNAAIKTLLKDNTRDLYNRVSVVTFNETASIRKSWTGPNDKKFEVDYTAKNGTNIQAGMNAGYNALQTRRTDSNVASVMIVLSDGVPCYYYTNLSNHSTGKGYSEDGSGYESDTPDKAVYYTIAQANEIKSQIPDLQIYTIGYSIFLNGYGQTTLDPTENLQDDHLSGWVKGTRKVTNATESRSTVSSRETLSWDWGWEWSDPVTTTTPGKTTSINDFDLKDSDSYRYSDGDPYSKEKTVSSETTYYHSNGETYDGSYRRRQEGDYRITETVTATTAGTVRIPKNYLGYYPNKYYAGASGTDISKIFTNIIESVTAHSPLTGPMVVTDTIGEGFVLSQSEIDRLDSLGASYDSETGVLTWTIDENSLKTINHDATTTDGAELSTITFRVSAAPELRPSETYYTNKSAGSTFKPYTDDSNVKNPYYFVDATIPGSGAGKSEVDGNGNVAKNFTSKGSLRLKPNSVTITKKWEDNNNAANLRPATITLQIKNGDTVVASRDIETTANTKTETFDVPKYDGKTPISYTADEAGKAEGDLKHYKKSINGTVITNTYEATSLTVTKNWNDKGNQDGLRPESITVQLKDNNGNVVKEGTLSGNSTADQWSLTWNNLPKWLNNSEIDYTTYSVVETGVSEEHYAASIAGISKNDKVFVASITNTHTPATVSKTVKKVWNDNDNQDGLRPASIEVQLYGNNEKVGDPVTLNAENGWDHTWSDLPEKANGQNIAYTVEEVVVPTGYAVAYNGFTITNSHTPATVSKTVNKAWDDNDNQDGIRPNNVKVQLLGNNENVGDPVTLSEANNWTHTWENLPEKANGQNIAYTVREENVPQGYTPTYGNMTTDNITITNSHTPATTSRTVDKVWNDNGDQDGLRPDSIEVQLRGNNGEAVGEVVTLNADNQWSYTWNNLPEKVNGQLISYTVEEVNIPTGYTPSYDGMTITNNHTPATVNKTVNKVWSDDDNRDGIRPNSVQVQLLADGDPLGDAVTLNQANSWSHTWNDLPKMENGQEIEYTVTEEAVPGYTPSYNGMTITNVHEPATAEKTVTKIWSDADDQDGLRPDSIEVQLLGNGNDVGSPVTLNEENNWSYTWDNLPEKENGQNIVYTVEEVNVPNGYTPSYNGMTITNAHEPATVTRTTNKIWNDNNNQDGLRPDSVSVQLYANGNAYGDVVTLNVANGWTYTWNSLPEKANGQNITYTVVETEVPAGYAVTYSGMDITNSHTPAVTERTVTKTWDDANNQDGLRPGNVTVQLYADGTATGDPVVLNDNKNWSHTWTGLPEKANGQTINYTVQETKVGDAPVVNGEAAGYTVTVNGFAITNSHTPAVVNKTVTKTWNDSSNQDGIRPDSVTAQLYADGTATGDPVVLNSGNNWSHTWTGLPEKANGQTISYTVQETKVGDTPVENGEAAGYAVTINGLDITNTHSAATVSRTINKTWDDNNDQDGIRPDSVTVRLLADGNPYATVTLNEGNGWSYTWNSLPERKDGQVIQYTVDEPTVPDGYQEAYDGMTVINSHTPTTTSKTVNKVWDDNNDQDGVRPDSIEVQLLGNGEVVGTDVTLNEGNSWSYTWENLPEKANGQPIVYTAEEVSVPDGYEVSYSGMTITNTHTLSTTEKTVNKVWDDNDNQDGIRPAEVSVQLYGNGGAVGEPVTLNEENNWSYTWEGLQTNANGQSITYTVEELEVPDGYEVSYNGLTVTNTHTPAVTTKTATKIWDDNDNQDGIRPTEIEVQLYGNNEAVGSVVTLSEDSNWSYTWNDLPQKASGEDIVYTVTEVNTPDGYTPTYNGMTITNSHTPAKVSKEVIKLWSDADNQDGIRPNSIEVQLLGYNNEPVGDPVTLNETNGWRYTWSDLPENANGQLIEYTVEELNVPDGYTPTYSGMTITNVHTPATAAQTVTKIWSDNNNQDGLRPDSIQVQLFGNDKEVGDPVTLNAANNWSYTWQDLPEKANGTPIVYTVEELNVPNGYTPSYNGMTITNVHVPAATGRTVTKIWDDNNNQDGLRPTNISVQLYADGAAYGDPVTLNESNNWTYTWNSLPEKNAGKDIVYSVGETVVPDGYTVSYKGMEITNTHVTAVTSRTVSKVWDDNNNQDGLRPSNVTVQLYADGTATGEPVVLNDGNNWTHTWNNLPEKAAGQLINYTVQETKMEETTVVGGTAREYTVTVNGFEITNTHTPAKTTRTVTKKWNDRADQDGLRPGTVTMQLYADGSPYGEPVTLDGATKDADDNWIYTWTDLPEKRDGGQRINYTVAETYIGADPVNDQNEAAGYTVSYVGMTVTNTHAPEVMDIPVSKTWLGDDEASRPAVIEVSLLANDEVVDSYNLTASDNWTHTFKNMPVYANGEKITYTVDETLVDGYTKEISGFTIINTYQIGTVELTASKLLYNQDSGQHVSADANLFTFKLYDVTNSEKLIQTSHNNADGDILFKPLVYDYKDEGTHVYELREAKQVPDGVDEEAYTFDDTVYTFYVDVTVNEDNTIMVEKSISSSDGGDSLDVSEVVFENTYTTPVNSFIIRKQLIGNSSETFEFELSFNGTPYTGEYMIDNDTFTAEDGKVYIPGNKEAVFHNIVKGSEYVVTETDSKGHAVLADGSASDTVSGTISSKNAGATVAEFINIPKEKLVIAKTRVGGNADDVFTFNLRYMKANASDATPGDGTQSDSDFDEGTPGSAKASSRRKNFKSMLDGIFDGTMYKFQGNYDLYAKDGNGNLVDKGTRTAKNGDIKLHGNELAVINGFVVDTEYEITEVLSDSYRLAETSVENPYTGTIGTASNAATYAVDDIANLVGFVNVFKYSEIRTRYNLRSIDEDGSYKDTVEGSLPNNGYARFEVDKDLSKIEEDYFSEIYKKNGAEHSYDLVTVEVMKVNANGEEKLLYSDTDTTVSMALSEFNIHDLDTNAVYRISVDFIRVRGSVVLHKYGINETPLQGAKFQLYNDDNQKVGGVLTTDGEGKIVKDNLLPGSYYFVEVEAPAGYVLDTTPQEFQLESTNNYINVVELSMENEIGTGSVVLKKTDADGKALSGVKFNLYDADGGQINDNVLETNGSGQIEVGNLALGSYYFLEEEALPGYIKNAAPIYFNITFDDIASGKAVTPEPVVNAYEEDGVIVLTKTDRSGNALAGAVFDLYRVGENVPVGTNLMTGDDGKLTVDGLAIGSYYFVETKAPEGYVTPVGDDAKTPVMEVKFAENIRDNNQIEITVENDVQTGSVKLVKTNSNETQNLSGAVFNLYRADGTLVAENLVTDANGAITYENLPVGSYYFQETKAPTGYRLPTGDDAITRFIVEYNSVTVVNVTNAKSSSNNNGGGGGNDNGGGDRTPGDTTGGPGATIPDTPVPLANLPGGSGDNGIVINDGQIPLAALPKTGDSPFKGLMALFTGLMLGLAALFGKKKKEDEQ